MVINTLDLMEIGYLGWLSPLSSQGYLGKIPAIRWRHHLMDRVSFASKADWNVLKPAPCECI